MSDLDKALEAISSIRMQMARTTEFRGYGPATLAGTAAIAALAAAMQAALVRDPASHIFTYLGIWITTAVLCAGLTCVQMLRRSRRIHSAMSDEMIRMAVQQFMPSVGAGLFLTIVLVHYTPAIVWTLPGLWQIIFSLGIFSSCRFLPRPVVAAAIWYLFTGLACISLNSSLALSPWAMGVPFAVGQTLVAAVLFRASRKDADEI